MDLMKICQTIGGTPGEEQQILEILEKNFSIAIVAEYAYNKSL